MIVCTHLGHRRPPWNLHRRPHSSPPSLRTGELFALMAVVAPLFTRRQTVRGWWALIVRTHLGRHPPRPPRTLPTEALPLPSFSCASGVVCACLSLPRLCSRVDGGVLLRVFGLCRINRMSHLRRGCRTKTTSSAKLFAFHAFYTRLRSPYRLVAPKIRDGRPSQALPLPS